MDKDRRKNAEDRCGNPVTLRKQSAYRLPLAERVERVSTLIESLSYLQGGAKQTLHYTDLTPAIMMFAVTPAMCASSAIALALPIPITRWIFLALLAPFLLIFITGFFSYGHRLQTRQLHHR